MAVEVATSSQRSGEGNAEKEGNADRREMPVACSKVVFIQAVGVHQGRRWRQFARTLMVINHNNVDTSISRQNHAAIAYDNEQKSFFLGHGGKANLVRLNGRPVLSTEELQSEDTVRIGETTLRFIAMCGDSFSWDQDQEGEARNASVG